LKADTDVALLFETMREVQKRHPFRLLAYVILPDHLHWLLKVQVHTGENFSTVMQSIKRNFTLNYKDAHNIDTPLQLWQPRFWDHIIRDQEDMNNHFDYIHYNPVKHGYAARPEDWSHSTYHFWLERGYYTIGWGHAAMPGSVEGMEYE
jgi:putative transposase